MLYVLPAVSVSFQKQSANTVITSGNNTYQFTGATFDVFESASGARVGTIQMDGNGQAQAALLPNTAYYLVETTAPAGYIPLHDRIAFTTTDNGGYVTIDEQPGTITLRIVKLDAATNAGPQVGLRSQEQNSCAYRNQPLDGHKLSGPMKAVELPSPMSPWEPLPSMNRGARGLFALR